MAITSLDALLSALGNACQSMVVNKASITGMTGGSYCSMFRATGVPASGAIPAAASLCDPSLTGALPLTYVGNGISSYLARVALACNNPATDIQIHDRLAHMGGLSGIVTTAQTVGVAVNVTTSNVSTVRIGKSDFSEVLWWLEWYTTTGTTAVTATITYTNGAGVTGKTRTVSVPASTPAGKMIPIVGSNGEAIQSVQTVALSATTGTAGSFGVTATRLICNVPCYTANFTQVMDWASLGLPFIDDYTTMMLVALCSTTSSGTINGVVKAVHG